MPRKPAVMPEEKRALEEAKRYLDWIFRRGIKELPPIQFGPTSPDIAAFMRTVNGKPTLIQIDPEEIHGRASAVATTTHEGVHAMEALHRPKQFLKRARAYEMEMGELNSKVAQGLIQAKDAGAWKAFIHDNDPSEQLAEKIAQKARRGVTLAPPWLSQAIQGKRPFPPRFSPEWREARSLMKFARGKGGLLAALGLLLGGGLLGANTLRERGESELPSSNQLS